MTDAFEEVEERLREDKWQTFLKKWGLWIVAGVFAFAFSFGGFRAWQGYQADQAGKAAMVFGEARTKLEAGDFVGAEAAFNAAAKKAPRTYKALAHIQRSAALQGQGDLKAALIAMDLAAATARDPSIKELAQLKAAYLAADLEDFASVETRVKPLIAESGQISFMARELLGAEAFEAGQLDKARIEFNYLTTALDAPSGVKDRARAFLAALGPSPTPAPTPPATPPAQPKTGEKK